jgi:putative membrane protein
MLRKILIVAAIFIPTASVAAPPAEFLRTAIKGNYSEVTLGRLIQRRASTSQVRDFGAMLVRDHSRGLDQAQAIAARMGIRVSVRMTPEALHERALLQRLRGRTFDREVRRYMIEDHVKDIAAFRAQARTGDRATSRYAAAIVPVMQHHLATARSIRA